jgi:hypothetical protein
MKTWPLQLIRNRGDVEVKYVQWTNGYAQVKCTDGFLYPVASFTCNSNFIKFCDTFNIWDGGRNNTVQG